MAPNTRECGAISGVHTSGARGRAGMGTPIYGRYRIRSDVAGWWGGQPSGFITTILTTTEVGEAL